MMKYRSICISLSAVLVFLLAACAVCQEQKAENFLSNGSFEIVNEKGFPVDWRFGSQPDDKDVANIQGFIDTEIKHEGKQSLRIVAKGVTAQYAGLMHGPIELDGPATYRFSGWIKAEGYGITPDPACGPGVHALWFFAKVRNTDQRLQSFSLAMNKAGTFDWTYTESEFKVPSPVTLEAAAWKGYNGTVWVDDIRIERVGKREITQTERAPKVGKLVADFPRALKSNDGSFAVLFAPPVKKITRRVTARDGALSAGPRARISLARNEYEAVQLILAPLSGELSVAFSASPLRKKGSADGVPGASVTVQPVGYVSYSDGKTLITEPWPDPVLEDETKAIVRPDELQPLWVEVYVPTGAPAGKYETMVTLTRADKEVLTVPVDVTVYDFALPATPSLPTAMSANEMLAQEQLMTHRIGLTYTCHPMLAYDNLYDKKFWRVEREFEEVKPFVEKTLARIEAHGWRHFNVEIPRFPGTFPGGANSIGAFQKWRPNYSEAQREYIVRYYRDYAKYLKDRGVFDHATVYLFDEPEHEVFDLIRDFRELIRKADPDLPCMVVGHIWPELVGVVDIWCPLIDDFEKKGNVVLLHERQAAGEKVWAYNTCEEPPYAGWIVDPKCDLLSTRLLFWIVRKCGLDGFLHWACDRAMHPIARLGESTDCYLPKGPGAYVFGGGQLVYSYPVLAKDLASEDSMPTRVIPSIRLKAIRDGLEDYDYFVLLEKAVKQAKKRGVKPETVRRAEMLLRIPDKIATSFKQYTGDAGKTMGWRDRVAKAIETLAHARSGK